MAGSNFVLLPAAGGQSMHGDRAALVGELAVVPPLLGSSQRLLNRDHHSVYYKVPCWHCTYPAYVLSMWKKTSLAEAG